MPGKSKVCISIFWIKVFFAVLIALGAISFQAFVAYNFHITFKKGQTPVKILSPIIRIPNASSSNASLCYFNSTSLARLEPPNGHRLWGFDIQWHIDSPDKLVSRLKQKPSIFNTFVSINTTDFDFDTLIWNAQNCQKNHAMLEISLMPSVNIENIPDSLLYSVAVTMRRINSLYGTPVFLRYGHEMNGNWMIHYGMRPIQYIASFRKLASYVHNLTNLTAMVWSPNVGAGYPHSGNNFTEFNPTENDSDPLKAANFLALNTARTGSSARILDGSDDPYTPFYPGDEYVDWIGVSVYNYAKTSSGQTALASYNTFVELISGSGRLTDIQNLYGRFSQERRKPFFITETGSSFDSNVNPNDRAVTPSANSPTEFEIKKSWWDILIQAFNDSRFPRLKAIVWFEENKVEQTFRNAAIEVNRDYRITFNDTFAQAFIGDISKLNISWGNTINFYCNVQMSNRLCAFMFWIKVTVSISAAIIAIAYQLALKMELKTKIVIPDVNDMDASKCYFKSLSKARLEPPSDGFLWGFDLQWNEDTPSKLVKRIGKRPAIFNSFIKMNDTDFERDTIVWNAQETGMVGGILSITLVPTVDVEKIPDSLLYSIAELMRSVNTKYGTPVLLRFMHEMNGNWFPSYGMRPIEFKQAFIKLATYVHQLTNVTAMLWSPNIGGGYPYHSNSFEGYIPKINDQDQKRRENFKLLNTDNSGSSANVIDQNDDPYGPYYPGDEYVDWVGLSIYNLNRDANTRQTSPVSAGVFTNANSGVMFAGNSNSLRNFYQRFSVSKRKPFILSETGSSYVTDVEGGNMVLKEANPKASELASKQSWWRAVLENSAQMHMWKAAVWFEEMKEEESYDDPSKNIIRNYRITYDDGIKSSFLDDMNADKAKVLWANDLNFTCSGDIIHV